MADVDYVRENVVAEVKSLAEVRLRGPFTLEVRVWQDGDFMVEAFHTLNTAAGDQPGTPFHRERIAFSTTGCDEGWLRHEVTRRWTGETGCQVLYSDRFSGYTPNWPAPLEDDDEDDERGFRGPRYSYPGRFA